MKKIKAKFKEIMSDKYKFWVFIGTCLFLLIGLVSFVVGAYLTGWNVLACLVTPMAFTIYFIILFIVLPIIIYAVVVYWGSKDER